MGRMLNRQKLGFEGEGLTCLILAIKSTGWLIAEHDCNRRTYCRILKSGTCFGRKSGSRVHVAGLEPKAAWRSAVVPGTLCSSALKTGAVINNFPLAKGASACSCSASLFTLTGSVVDPTPRTQSLNPNTMSPSTQSLALCSFRAQGAAHPLIPRLDVMYAVLRCLRALFRFWGDLLL